MGFDFHPDFQDRGLRLFMETRHGEQPVSTMLMKVGHFQIGKKTFYKQFNTTTRLFCPQLAFYYNEKKKEAVWT